MFLEYASIQAQEIAWDVPLGRCKLANRIEKALGHFTKNKSVELDSASNRLFYSTNERENRVLYE